MSRLAEYRALELKLASDLARLESMKGDEKLKTEMQFEEKLTALMSKYGKSLRDVIDMLDPDAYSSRPAAAEKGVRKAREVKIYEHPDTKERVETKGGNQKTLKAWKAEFGDEMVESWRIQ